MDVLIEMIFLIFLINHVKHSILVKNQEVTQIGNISTNIYMLILMLKFNDATCTHLGNVWHQENFEKTLIPKILGSPKLTTFQHYLVQTSTDRKQLKHYSPQSDDKKTVIRGHKLYWHQGSKPDIQYSNSNEASGTQTTQIKPIKSDVHFTFTINFENLSDVELGALLWVLSISSDKTQAFGIGKQGEEYCLSLGMGKPLGMGAVKIEPELYLSDRNTRYQKLFDGNHWNEAETSASDEQQISFIKAFEKYVIDNISNEDKPKEGELNSLKDLPRIEMLYCLLRWNSPLKAEDTRYMTIKPTNEYRERPVLPTPLQIMNITDNRKLPTSSASSPENTPTKKFEKPIIKPKNNNRDSRPNNNRYNSGDGNSSNPAIQRPLPPKK